MRSNSFYTSFSAASKAARKLKIKTSHQYVLNYRRDSKLPSTPYRFYSDEWTGWPAFLGTNRTFLKKSKSFHRYETIEQAKIAARSLNVKSASDYYKKRNKDPLLPYYPNHYYLEEWKGWRSFLGTEKISKAVEPQLYKLLSQAKRATRELGIKSTKQYRERHMLNSRLPANPETIYISDWKGWPHFLGIATPQSGPIFYKTLTEASTAAKRLGATSARNYIKLYKKDPRLPSNPSAYYKNNWKDWETFLGVKNNKHRFYKTISEASIATRKLGITTARAYVKHYHQDDKLPSNPAQHYKTWKNWSSFLKR